MRKNYWIDGILGGAIGDAVGVPYEFRRRGEFNCTDIIGHGTHNQEKGVWSDDTSLTLATLDSINCKKTIDVENIYANYRKWLFEGKYTATGSVFDCGVTTENAIINRKGEKSIHSNGNGSLMRIMPVCLYVYDKRLPDKEAIKIIHEISGLTHDHIISKIGCGLYYFCVKAILSSKKDLFSMIQEGLRIGLDYYKDIKEIEYYKRLSDLNDFKKIKEENINSSGFVVDTLEASIWSLINTNNYKQSILKAVNLGNDTDTITAVTGGLSGLIYGEENFPEEWKKSLKKYQHIKSMCINDKPLMDIHSHIMYGLDDGAEDFDMSAKMIEIEYNQGVRHIFLTSHSYAFYSNKDIDIYNNHFNKLKRFIYEKYIDMEIYMGCEIMCRYDYIEDIIKSLNNNLYLTLNNTNKILIEFDPRRDSLTVNEIINCVRIFLKNGYIPVIAHIERYCEKFNKDEWRFLAVALRELGCLEQMNYYSVNQCPTPITIEQSRWAISKNLVDFMGSDSHRLDYRYPEIKNGATWLYDTYQRAEKITTTNLEKIL